MSFFVFISILIIGHGSIIFHDDMSSLVNWDTNNTVNITDNDRCINASCIQLNDNASILQKNPINVKPHSNAILYFALFECGGIKFSFGESCTSSISHNNGLSWDIIGKLGNNTENVSMSVSYQISDEKHDVKLKFESKLNGKSCCIDEIRIEGTTLSPTLQPSIEPTIEPTIKPPYITSTQSMISSTNPSNQTINTKLVNNETTILYTNDTNNTINTFIDIFNEEYYNSYIRKYNILILIGCICLMTIITLLICSMIYVLKTIDLHSNIANAIDIPPDRSETSTNENSYSDQIMRYDTDNISPSNTNNEYNLNKINVITYYVDDYDGRHTSIY